MSLRGRRGPRSLRRVLAALVAGLAVVLGVLIAAAIIGILSTASDYRDGAERARGRQQVANALLTDLLSAQSANRAYILLPSGDNLAEYQVARDQYPAAMEELRERVRGEPELEASATPSTGRRSSGSPRRSSSSGCAARGASRRRSAASTRASARRGSTPSARSTASCSRGSSESAPTRWRPTTAGAC